MANIMKALEPSTYFHSDGSFLSPGALIRFVHMVPTFARDRVMTKRATTEELEAFINLVTTNESLFEIAAEAEFRLRDAEPNFDDVSRLAVILANAESFPKSALRAPQDMDYFSYERTNHVLRENVLRTEMALLHGKPPQIERHHMNQIVASWNQFGGWKNVGTSDWPPAPSKPPVYVPALGVAGPFKPLKEYPTEPIKYTQPFVFKLPMRQAPTFQEPFQNVNRIQPIVHPSAERNTGDQITQTGLQNFGNTCYMNAAFQLLAQSQNFVSALKNTVSSPSALEAHVLSVCKILVALSVGNASLAHEELTSFVRWLTDSPSGGTESMDGRRGVFKPESNRQQDSHEFLYFVIHEILGKALGELKGVSWALNYIGFRPGSRRICNQCETQVDLDLDLTEFSLQLVIPPVGESHEFTDLAKETQLYVAEELEWNCNPTIGAPGCTGKTAKRINYIKSCRDIVIVIQRLAFDPINRTPVKRFEFVNLPEGEFDFVPPNATADYPSVRLYIKAVIHHIGARNDTGHFFAFIRPHFPQRSNKEWVRCDDGTITTDQSWENVNTKHAYMLLCCPVP